MKIAALLVVVLLAVCAGLLFLRRRNAEQERARLRAETRARHEREWNDRIGNHPAKFGATPAQD